MLCMVLYVPTMQVMGELAVSRAFGDSEFKGGGNPGRGDGEASATRCGRTISISLRPLRIRTPRSYTSSTQRRRGTSAQLLSSQNATQGPPSPVWATLSFTLLSSKCTTIHYFPPPVVTAGSCFGEWIARCSGRQPAVQKLCGVPAVLGLSPSLVLEMCITGV